MKQIYPLTIAFSCLVTFLCCFVTSTAFGVNQDSLKQRYQQAKFYYNQLETSQSLSKDRSNWLKGTSNFRRIYLSSPKSDYAPACLYMLGKMYFKMYSKFNKGIDLGESLSYYRDTTSLFPEHRLADDAIYAVGLILLENIHDPKRAAKSFAQIVSKYPNGDMHSQASDKLKELSKDHDIPLPGSMVGNSSLKDLNYVLPVKYWSSNNYTRVVVKASGPVTYKAQLLEQQGQQPRRLYIDFKNSYIEPKYRAPIPIQDRLLKQIRTGQFSSDTVRVVLDIDSISDYKIFSLPNPFRVVIDVRGKDAKLTSSTSNNSNSKGSTLTQNMNEANGSGIIILRETKKIPINPTEPAISIAVDNQSIKDTSQEKAPDTIQVVPPKEAQLPTHGKKISLAQQLGLGVRKIIIDPGHGGKDPGAMAFNLREKDIVLNLAQKLVPLLENEIGCEVLLTRDSDVYIPLEERTAIANTNEADLFISLHVNAHPSPKVKGLETYYLNLSTNAEAMRVAARENATSTHQMSDLQDILSDIMKNSKINESSRLAEQVHSSILTGLQEEEFENIRNLGVKQAPFYVLIGAEMPAILIEIAFISNPEEAEFLQDPHYLDILADEIAEGIRSYIQNTTAAL